MTHPGPEQPGTDPHGGPWQQPAPGQQPYGQQPPPPYAGQPPYAGYPPAYGQPPYGQPPYGYGFPPPRRTNGMAVASMVLGILWIYWIGSVLALVFGYIAKRQIQERGESGGGMATAGIVLGWIGIGFLALAVVAGIASSSSYGY
ncbi:DUF4190 domain-containing protein [Blastococcus sp. TML/C7B]|uniref:DUF4190 domain-containing protein n=1 Tax=Blastococcus sp. TML/C7B TaxID=2798728 RepID=UPI001909B50B|nr:DUF4190 domain-containing protein [Blastococcus sp. TML/C7B]MBN1095478.1 DUF4190 domain-containing protein [Blastococcus sp. TML/C7B]